MRQIEIARQFSATPGARYVSDGPYSGELFRTRFLEPLFEAMLPGSRSIKIVLDGVEGYPPGFLDEAFGTLAVKYGRETVESAIVFVSRSDPRLVDEIIGYIRNAW